MKILKSIAIAFVLLAAFLGAAPAWAQTATTALVLGTVTDPGGAVVPDAAAELTNTATNESKSVTTNSAGQYVFPNVSPGTYTLKISKTGFATTTFSNIKLDVSKSYTFDAKLEVSSGKEIVEVSAGAVAELQTADATIGNVIGGTTISRLPTLGRDASELLTLQPGSTPYDSSQVGFGNNGGTIAGARSDQNSIILDGIDVSDNVIAGGGNEQPIIPIGVESVDEFRAEITNENVTFLRSSGGQVDVISKSGGNSFHGSTYWFHQNSALNANSWDNNRNKIKKPPTHDNRGGVWFGGPLRKDKTFFFSNYEFRRFPQSLQNTRIMPSDQLRQGILQFQDCAQGFQQQPDGTQKCQGGTLNKYDFNPADTATFNPALCGSDTNGQPLNLPCDPRGIGISPTIAKLWGMMPNGTDATLGDGTNTLGDHLNFAAPLKTDFVSFRLDHKFTNKVQFFGRYIYSRNIAPNGGQADLRSSSPINSSASNIRGDGQYGGLDWQIRPNLTNSFRGGWIRARQDFTVIRPRDSAAQLALPGTDSADGFVALAPGLAQTGFIDTIVDVDTQRARHQAIYDSSKQYNDMITWTKGKHTVSAGADIRWLPTIHDRDDKVIGSVNSLVAAMDSDVSFIKVSPANRPATCAPQSGAIPAVTTNCILASDVQRWDRLYAASLGLIDNVNILTVRDGSLNPKPLGTSLIAKTTLRMYEFFVQDSWRMSPSLTLTYGLGYGWQTTPQELHQQQTLIANHDAGDQILNTAEYFKQRTAAAAAGDIFNPTLSYIPVTKSGRNNVFNVDYGDIAPRASLAWNPSFSSGVPGHLFGNKKTVVRMGYGIGYDRVNTVQSVIIPMLGVGFAQTINLIGPACDATSVGGGPKCKTNGTTAGSLFRVGVDGQIPVPANPSALQSPIVPDLGFSEILSFQNDPDFKVGRSHMIDFTLQRELPGQNILEIGYVGRLGRNLAGSFNLNSIPYFFKDKASGQTFAQAFDAVATALRNGQPIVDQPWFENQLPSLQAFSDQPFFGGPPLFSCPAATSATTCMGAIAKSGFINGLVSSMFTTIDFARLGYLGLQPYDNLQVFDLFMRSHKDYSNYHALVVTLRNRPWHGVLYDMNYTFSKSLDTVGAVQNSASYYATSFHPGYEYGPSLFDRTHVYNGTFNYDLPFGKGHRLGSSHEAFNKLIGGWYTAGVVRFSSGIPLVVQESGQVFGGGAIFSFPTGEIPLVNPNSLNGGVHFGVTGSNGVGTASDPKSNGSGINYFGDPSAALKQFRPILLASDTSTGRSRPLRGFWFKNLDLRLGKVTKIRENLGIEYSFDFFNAFNHPIFLDPTLDTTNLPNFGVVNTQYIPANRNTGSRWIQFGLRVEF